MSGLNNFKENQKSSQEQTFELFLKFSYFDIEELFDIHNILDTIKFNISKFVNYIKTRKSIIKKLIYYLTRINQNQIICQKIKKYCYYSCQILCFKTQDLLDLYFPSQSQMQIQNHQSQNVSAKSNEKPKKYQILEYLMDYLVERTPDDLTSDGYFFQVMKNILRNKGQDFLNFLSEKSEYIPIMMEGASSSYSLGKFIGQIIGAKISNKNNIIKNETFQKIKYQIVIRYTQILLNNFNNDQTFEDLLYIVQYIIIERHQFNSSSQLKLSLNMIFSRYCINYALNKLTNPNPIQLGNISDYFHIFAKIFNIQRQQFQIQKKIQRRLRVLHSQNFISKFEASDLYVQFPKLATSIIKLKCYQQSKSKIKMKVLVMLLQLCKNRKFFRDTYINFIELILIFLEEFSKLQCEILKTLLIQLIYQLITHCPKQIFTSLHLNLVQFIIKYFPNLSKIHKNVDILKNPHLFGSQIYILLLIETRLPQLCHILLNVFNINVHLLRQRFSSLNLNHISHRRRLSEIDFPSGESKNENQLSSYQKELNLSRIQLARILQQNPPSMNKKERNNQDQKNEQEDIQWISREQFGKSISNSQNANLVPQKQNIESIDKKQK